MAFWGYEFVNAALLEEALTTPSFRMDHHDAVDNQRLEFLGDSVLGFLAAERLYGEFPGEAEGKLTVRRTHMVSAAALCEAADQLGLAQLLKRNRAAQPLPKSSKIIADAVEAIIGAAYVDGGFEAARKIFETLSLKGGECEGEWSGNPKGELQVRTQAMRPPRRPEYTLLSTAGKAHEPIFNVRVFVDGVGEATASAGTRRDADAAAAALLLQKISCNKKG